MAKRDRPDLILMDLIMPHMDGVQATRQIMACGPVRDPRGHGHGERQHLARLRRDGLRRPRRGRHADARPGRRGERRRGARREDRHDRQARRGDRRAAAARTGRRHLAAPPRLLVRGRLDGRPQGDRRPALPAAARLERGGRRSCSTSTWPFRRAWRSGSATAPAAPSAWRSTASSPPPATCCSPGTNDHLVLAEVRAPSNTGGAAGGVLPPERRRVLRERRRALAADGHRRPAHRHGPGRREGAAQAADPRLAHDRPRTRPRASCGACPRRPSTRRRLRGARHRQDGPEHRRADGDRRGDSRPA